MSLVPKGVQPSIKTYEPPPKEKTSRAEWIVLIIITIIVIAIILYIFLVLRNNLFKSTSPPNTDPLVNPKGCPTSSPPTNIFAEQNLLSRTSIDITWNPVFTTTTPDEFVLGYNVYVSKSPNITESISPQYTQAAFKRVYKDSLGINLITGVKYYINVATVDSCGAGELNSANEISFTPLAPV